MVPVFQTLIEKRIPSKGSIIGTVLVFIGILFLSSGGESIFEFFDELGSNFNFGDFLTLICAVLFALHVVYLDLYSKKENYKVLVFYQISLSALLGFLFAFLLAGLNIEPLEIEITGTSFFGIVYTGILATLVTTYLQTRYQKEVSPTKAGIVYSFEPIFAALIAFFVLSEKITNFGFIGSILIVSGLLVSELYDSFGGKRLSEKGSN
jgi:drug/metabolite transporter (DMT)-like permease